ncbi:ALP1-like protein [Tanacetum coccineum]
MNLYGEEFLRKLTYTNMEKLYAHHDEKHEFPGMLGSIDCIDWPWANCPDAYRAQFSRGDHGSESKKQHRDDDPVRTHEESMQVT